MRNADRDAGVHYVQTAVGSLQESEARKPIFGLLLAIYCELRHISTLIEEQHARQADEPT